VVQEAVAQQESDRRQFGDELRADREQLEADLEAWHREAKELTLLGNVAQVLDTPIGLTIHEESNTSIHG